jgi:hypothetical protein
LITPFPLACYLGSPLREQHDVAEVERSGRKKKAAQKLLKVGLSLLTVESPVLHSVFFRQRKKRPTRKLKGGEKRQRRSRGRSRKRRAEGLRR